MPSQRSGAESRAWQDLVHKVSRAIPMHQVTDPSSSSPAAAPPHLTRGLDSAMLLICRLAFFRPHESGGAWTGQLIRSR